MLMNPLFSKSSDQLAKYRVQPKSNGYLLIPAHKQLFADLKLSIGFAARVNFIDHLTQFPCYDEACGYSWMSYVDGCLGYAGRAFCHKQKLPSIYNREHTSFLSGGFGWLVVKLTKDPLTFDFFFSGSMAVTSTGKLCCSRKYRIGYNTLDNSLNYNINLGAVWGDDFQTVGFMTQTDGFSYGLEAQLILKTSQHTDFTVTLGSATISGSESDIGDDFLTFETPKQQISQRLYGEFGFN